MSSLRSLTLVVSERCNLRCAYCKVPKETARSMRPETVDAAVDWLVREGAAEPVLSFYGGEPFLESELLIRAVERARKAFGTRVRVNTPTNALLMHEAALAFARRERLELTISIDGTTVPSERRDVGGRDVTASILERVPALLALSPECRVLARMTVVPSNVARLATHVRSLYALGFRTIVYQPAYEADWAGDSIDCFGREHARIGTWFVGLVSLGKSPPVLEPWRGIAQRLSRGASRVHCGAGVDSLAVAPGGAIYPCYRFAAEPGGERYQLGDLCRGVTEKALRDEFAALDPHRLEPQGGNCATCTARDGCGHFCPAGGALLADGLRSVPAVTCALIRAQVAAIRPYREH